MKQIDSKYRQFPTALELPDLPTDRQLARSEEMIAWIKESNLVYQKDFVCFEHQTGKPGHSKKVTMAWAFRDRGTALHFKLTFGGWR